MAAKYLLKLDAVFWSTSSTLNTSAHCSLVYERPTQTGSTGDRKRVVLPLKRRGKDAQAKKRRGLPGKIDGNVAGGHVHTCDVEEAHVLSEVVVRITVASGEQL